MTDNDCAITEAPKTPSEDPPAAASLTPTKNLEAMDLDDDVQEKLKGNLIGNTMYSQSFVIKLCMKLHKVEELVWNDELESDFDFLWEMTDDKDVCSFLLELNYPLIVINILQNNNEGVDLNHKIIEVTLGILANVYCHQTPELPKEHVNILLDYINSTDTYILLQLMRIIKFMICPPTVVQSIVTPLVMEKIVYILYNSISVSLLDITLSTVSKFTEEQALAVDELHESLLEACFVAFKVIYDSENESDGNAYDSEVVQNSLVQLIRILVNFAVYCNENDCEQTTNIRKKVREYREVILDEIIAIIESHGIRASYFMESISYIIEVFALECNQLTVTIIQMGAVFESESDLKSMQPYLELCRTLLEKSNVQEVCKLLSQDKSESDKFYSGLSTVQKAFEEETNKDSLAHVIEEFVKARDDNE